MSVALNNLANIAQRVTQETVMQNFTVRQKPFILNTIKRQRPVDFATKQNLVSAVRVDQTRDFLAKFERGGEKHAIQGKPYVAVPSKDIRRNKRGLIPRNLMPSAFKPFTDHASGLTTGQERTFIVPTKSGNRLLLQRYGGARGKHGIRALYLFVPEVHIPAILHLHDNAIEVARSSWPTVMREAWAFAMRTAR
jgi:hypothetical protein